MSVLNSPILVESLAAVARRLILIWQNPDSRQFVRVGHLDELVDGRYAFQYCDDVDTIEGFHPLTQFPNTAVPYVSETLPAFFGNRLMSKQRSSYSRYLDALGLDSSINTPMELLARTGGPRATDTFHLVDDFRENAEGRVVSRFLASGVRYVESSGERLRELAPGSLLRLASEPDNPSNPRAQLLCVEDGAPVGYVPDWLLEDVEDLRSRASEFEVIAEQVSPDAQPHLRLLCRIEATVV
ncbi:MAG: hypothetical protein QM673_11735 [Gordonia sp. (in: high G+C Gram-positive bacteria)]